MSLRVLGSISNAFAGLAGPWKNSPLAFWVSGELDANHSGRAYWPRKKSGT